MPPPSSSSMRQPAPSTRPHLCRRPVALVTVAISMALLSVLCLPVTADANRALHYHRKHRRHYYHYHRRHRAANNSGHISLPPAALPPGVDADYSPAEPPGLPPDGGGAPPPSSRHRTPCCPPPRPPPSVAPAPAPAKPPSHSNAKSPSLSPARPPSLSPSHAKPTPCTPAKLPVAQPPRVALPPRLSPASPPTRPPAKPSNRAPAPPPHLAPAKPPTPSPSHLPPSVTPVGAPAPAPSKPPSHSHAKPPSLSPARPPSLTRAKPTPCTPAKAPHAQAQPPRPPPSPVRPPLSSPANPPAHPPSQAVNATAQPPRLAPAKPPTPSPWPAQPPRFAPAKASSPSPAQPPQHSPANPPASPAASPAKPPALPPAISKPNPSPPPPPAAAKNGSSPCGGNVFDVRTFGASGNGSAADDTRAFRAAWKAACSSSDSNSTLLVPSDGVFTITSTIFAGPCKPGLTFQIDGVLMPPDGPASWPASDSRRQWLVFYRADGMTLAGKGTIEGNGEEWWDLPCKPHRGPNGSTLPGPCDSPALIRFFLSNDVVVRGLRIENSPQFHLKFDGCARVTVDNLSVSSPASSPNTDGIHVENTTAVQILNSRIYNGDDCVSIGAGCSDVHIENITCGHGHGISIGSLGARNTRACVSNVTVRNARILDSDNGLRIKTWQGGAGAVSAVEFAGVQLRDVRNCIVIDQYYCLGSGCANQSSAVRVDGVAYRDVRGTYNPRGGAPIRLACSDAVACTGITMSGVELMPAGDGGGEMARLADPYCWNAYGIMETLTLPPVYCLQEGRPESLQDQLTTC